LEAAFRRFEPAQRIQELESSLSELFCLVGPLLGCLDREPDPVNRHARLVSHLKLNRRGPRIRTVFDHSKNLIYSF
jgi:hypothetical protein